MQSLCGRDTGAVVECGVGAVNRIKGFGRSTIHASTVNDCVLLLLNGPPFRQSIHHSSAHIVCANTWLLFFCPVWCCLNQIKQKTYTLPRIVKVQVGTPGRCPCVPPYAQSVTPNLSLGHCSCPGAPGPLEDSRIIVPTDG